MLYSGEINDLFYRIWYLGVNGWEFCLYCYDFDSSLGGDNKGRNEFIFFLFFYDIFGVLIWFN